MPLLALGDDLAIQYIERGEQRGRAVAFVVMGHGSRASLLQRQTGLSTVQCLHLALLIAAEHQGMLGGREIQADDVFELFNELRTTRDFESRARGVA